MDALAKILDFIGKYAWAVFVTTSFVLFVPEDAARQIGLFELRSQSKGALWVLLVLTLVVSLGSAFQYIDRRVLDGWLEGRRREKKRLTHQRQVMDALALRLDSLDAKEQMWIKYCLFHNTQTLSAERGNRTAQSLHHKGIVEEGSGHILDLPFHIPDPVWRYLLENKEELLSEADRQDPRFPGALEKFRKGLWASL